MPLVPFSFPVHPEKKSNLLGPVQCPGSERIRNCYTVSDENWSVDLDTIRFDDHWLDNCNISALISIGRATLMQSALMIIGWTTVTRSALINIGRGADSSCEKVTQRIP